jgi:hypothetical protein
MLSSSPSLWNSAYSAAAAIHQTPTPMGFAVQKSAFQPTGQRPSDAVTQEELERQEDLRRLIADLSPEQETHAFDAGFQHGFTSDGDTGFHHEYADDDGRGDDEHHVTIALDAQDLENLDMTHSHLSASPGLEELGDEAEVSGESVEGEYDVDDLSFGGALHFDPRSDPLGLFQSSPNGPLPNPTVVPTTVKDASFVSTHHQPAYRDTAANDTANETVSRITIMHEESTAHNDELEQMRALVESPDVSVVSHVPSALHSHAIDMAHQSSPSHAHTNIPASPESNWSERMKQNAPSEYYGILAQVRRECQNLRELNEKLMQANDEAHRALGTSDSVHICNCRAITTRPRASNGTQGIRHEASFKGTAGTNSYLVDMTPGCTRGTSAVDTNPAPSGPTRTQIGQIDAVANLVNPRSVD